MMRLSSAMTCCGRDTACVGFSQSQGLQPSGRHGCSPLVVVAVRRPRPPRAHIAGALTNKLGRRNCGMPVTRLCAQAPKGASVMQPLRPPVPSAGTDSAALEALAAAEPAPEAMFLQRFAELRAAGGKMGKKQKKAAPDDEGALSGSEGEAASGSDAEIGARQRRPVGQPLVCPASRARGWCRGGREPGRHRVCVLGQAALSYDVCSPCTSCRHAAALIQAGALACAHAVWLLPVRPAPGDLQVARISRSRAPNAPVRHAPALGVPGACDASKRQARHTPPYMHRACGRAPAAPRCPQSAA